MRPHAEAKSSIACSHGLASATRAPEGAMIGSGVAKLLSTVTAWNGENYLLADRREISRTLV